ncbi:MAG: immunoglobulin domain-containing protein [Puniceicoccales bacterium]|jgi:alpha-tubulin suppressor-like RCC1 family protein|nr:immunoglobulin domain-containing protein [Puniceicoccales bacterium]
MDFIRLSRFSIFKTCATTVLALLAAATFSPKEAAAADVGEDRTLDVLFVYTPATERRFSGADGMKSRANSEIAKANKIYENSKITGKMRLVGVRRVEYNEASTFREDIAALQRTNDNLMDEVHGWRNETGADVVCLMRASDAEASGRGYILTTMNGEPDWAFSVIGPDVGWSFAHEIGHNQGCAHAREQNDGSGIFAYSFGYRMPGSNYCTVMAYPNETFPVRIDHFSNPEVSYNGHATGVAEGEPNAADNVKTINQTLPILVKYRAYKPGVATPVISPGGGNFSDEQTITITCGTEGATIRFTQDGSDVTEASPIYSEPFVLRLSKTIKARAFKSGAIPSFIATAVFNITYPNTVAPITFTPEGGTYENSVVVEISTTTPDATIRYTNNGSEVTEESPTYTRPITLKRSSTLKARGYKSKHNPTAEATSAYEVLELPVADRPIITITGDLLPEDEGGDGLTYIGPPTVTISKILPTDVLRYTIDSSSVTEESPLYEAPFIVTRSTRVRARSWREGHTPSDVREVVVKVSPIPVATPRITPGGGTYVNSVSVKLDSDTTRAYLYYTTDGSDVSVLNSYGVEVPSANATRYTGPFNLVSNDAESFFTVKVQGFDVDYIPSAQTSAGFRITTAAVARGEHGSQIAAGDSHSLFVNGKGVLSAAGRNFFGQLGTGSKKDEISPVIIAYDVSSVDSSQDHTLYVTTANALWGMGRNDYGQLGDGTTSSRTVPQQIADNILLASAGGYHSLFVTLDGRLNATGRNNYGQLGDGTIASKLTPVFVADNVLFAAAGAFHSLYVKGDGDLYAVGRNDDGQLGDGSIANRNTPQKIASNVIAVAAGDAHSLYLTANGDLYGMGSNALGQLGKDPADFKSAKEPTLIASGVKAIAAGDFHTAYVTGGGELWAAGSNTFGQLGQTPSPYSTAPVLVTTGAKAVSAGRAHTIVTLTNGTHLSVGANSYGQLGDGTTTDKNTLTTVPTLPITSSPVISPNGGTHSEFVEITLSGAAPFAEVRYTTDGSDVTETSTRYEVPFRLTASATVSARAYLPEHTPSNQVSARFTITPAVQRTAPVIQLQPVSKTVTAGDKVIFSVSATGAPVPTYQWRFNGNNISGATDSSYTIEHTTAAHVGAYDVVVTNIVGSATSVQVTLSLQNAPVITRQPVPQDVEEGENASFSITVASDSPLTYQWRRNGDILAGEGNATLSLANVKTTQSGVYDVVVSNIAGSVTSVPVSLSVRLASGAPTILRDPVAPDVAWVGGSVTLSVSASSASSSPLTYQWKKDGTAIAGAESSRYTISTLTTQDAGTYTVSVTNSTGTVESSPTTLVVQTPSKPQVTTPLPAVTEVGIGKSVVLSVQSTGNPPPSYQWFFNGNPISGATNETYTVNDITESKIGTYSVTITSGPNTISGGETKLVAVEELVILTAPRGEVEGISGEGVLLSVEVTPLTASLRYQWLLDGVNIDGATSATYLAQSTGLYSVRVSNGASEALGEIARVKIIGAPVIRSFTETADFITVERSPLFQVLNRIKGNTSTAKTIVAGDKVTFFVDVQGGTEPFTYTWFLDGKPIYDAPNANTYVAESVTRNVEYAVTVSNAAGEAKSRTISINVIAPPSIIVPPKSLELHVGSSASLSVTAAGAAQLTYQWYKNGNLLPKAVLNTLVFNNVTNADAGDYHVVINNPAGRPISSTPVTVSVSSTATQVSKTVTTTGTGSLSFFNGSVDSLNTSRGVMIQIQDGNLSIVTATVDSAAPTSSDASTASATPLKTGSFSLSGAALASIENAAAANATGEVTYAPAALVQGLRIVLAGTLNDSKQPDSEQPDDSIIEILSAQKLPNGVYTYERTGAKTARLSYAITYTDGTEARVETGVLLLYFDSKTSGSYTLLGEYDGVNNAGALTTGDLNGTGDFDLKSK